MAYSKIRLKTAATGNEGNPPTDADLELKEIAFDGVDALFIKRPSDGAIVKVSGGAPKGGTLGQVLTKKSDADGDVEWKAVDALPAGGSTGQILTQTATGPAWASAPTEIPAGGTAGQILTKTSTGYVWADAPTPGSQFPTGGTTGQVLTKTSTGEAWQNVPAELPAGGTAGQVLTKTTGGPAWNDAPKELPAGGTAGQVLTQTASGPAWADAAAGGGGSNTAPLVVVNLSVANGTTVTLDRSKGDIFTFTAPASFTIALSGAPAGGESIYIMRAANLGAATLINWPTNIVWVGGTQPNWSPAGWDEIHMRRSADGSRVLAYGLVGA